VTRVCLSCGCLTNSRQLNCEFCGERSNEMDCCACGGAGFVSVTTEDDEAADREWDCEECNGTGVPQ
jgi:hypothetical protein